MDKDARIYVAGHRGLAGSAVMRELKGRGYRNLISRTHGEVDLEESGATYALFEQTRPEYVFLAAAKVGGIHANNSYPAEFLVRNLLIEVNIIRAAHTWGVRRLMFLGSSCIYPRDCPQPIKEDYLLTGPLESTNRAYALAKIAGVEMCWSFNRQYGTRYLAAMPTNLYGPGDNYDLDTSHVLPALIRKMHEAKASGSPEVTLWGSGKPKREFLYSDDLARALVFLANLDDASFDSLLSGTCPLINIGCGEDISIRELAETVAEVVGFKGQFIYDSSRPDGTLRKVMDVSRIESLGWRPQVPLREGIAQAYSDFLAHAATPN